MAIKLRSIVEYLDKVNISRKEIELARESISYGGDDETMQQKQMRLKECEARLQILLDAEILG